MVDEHATTYENPFKFSGKELDDITGLYDHGARSRDPKICGWLNIDPLAEMFPEYSPYVYCYGNPMRYSDSDGMKAYSYDEVENPQVWGNFDAENDEIVLPEVIVTPNDNNKTFTKVNMGIGTFSMVLGGQAELIDYAVRTDYKSARKWSEFNKLTERKQNWRTQRTLGKTGAKYLKGAKVLGKVCYVGQVALSIKTGAEAAFSEREDKWNRVGKAGLDIAIGSITAFGGPVGWVIGGVYFVGDIIGVWDEMLGIKEEEEE